MDRKEIVVLKDGEEFRYPLIAGGDPEGDAEGEADTDNNDGGTATATVEDRTSQDTETEQDQDEDPSPGSVEAQLALLRQENQRLKREQAAMAKERRKSEAEARARDEKRREEQGQYKELAEERAREIEQLKTQIAERDKRDAERAQRSRVTAIADKLNYRDPNLAFPLLMDTLNPDEAQDTLEDDTLVEAALKRMSRDREYLVDKQRRSGAPVGRNGQGGKPDPQSDLAATILALTRSGGTP